MGARDLLCELSEAGLTIAAEGDRLLIRPASKLTDALRASLRHAKPELLSLLSRPHRLAKAEADRCHTQPWDDAACARFAARLALFLRHGLQPADAEDLAEQLILRDLDLDDRRLCVECRHYRPGRCGNRSRAGFTSRGTEPLPMQLQRCAGFGEPLDGSTEAARKGLIQQEISNK